MEMGGYEFNVERTAKKHLVTMTPGRAKKILERMNTENPRRLDASTANLYASDMKSGRWDENVPDTIKIGTNRKLLDGQHRLMGVVLANVPIRMWVEIGIPPEVAKNLDQNRPRTHAERARIAHADPSIGDNANIHTVRLFGRVIRREWGGAPKQSYGADEPIMLATAQAVAIIKKKIARTAGASSSAPVKAAMVLNYMMANDDLGREKVLNLISKWCNIPGHPPTRLHLQFERKYNENPNGQYERMSRFLEACALFDPETNQDSGRSFPVDDDNPGKREVIRSKVIKALGEVGQRLGKAV